MKDVVLFLGFLILPFLYWRGLFLVMRRTFDRPFLRARTGLQVHHLHFGVVAVAISALILVTWGKGFLCLAFLGLGLGLILDEFLPSLQMPGNRPLELELYRRTLWPTLALFAAVGLTALGLYLLHG
jgi:hypothetical protein